MSRRRPIVVAKAYNRRGDLIARAANSYSKTHPLQAKYAERVGKPKAIYLHAEIACLLKAGTQTVHRLMVERYYSNGEPALAKPCPICRLAIKDWGVKLVEYTE